MFNFQGPLDFPLSRRRKYEYTTLTTVCQELFSLFLKFFSNFIFATHKSVPAKEIFEALKEEGIYVRYFNKPRIDNYLRISIGTDEQMEAMLTFLEQYLQKREG